MRPQRPCLTCDALTRNPGGRCRTCQQARDRKRNTQPHRHAYTTTDYRAARQRARAGHYGPCIDCAAQGRTNYDDLTLDHVIPLIHGGTNHPSNWVVRCRSCNSRKGATVEKR